jgi:hypothetical protein
MRCSESPHPLTRHDDSNSRKLVSTPSGRDDVLYVNEDSNQQFDTQPKQDF